MDNIYGKVVYELSRTPGKENRQHSVRESNPLRGTLKVLTAALGLLLFCALVALLGFLYSDKVVSCEAVSEQYASALEGLSVLENNYRELKSHMDEVQVNYENALKRLDSFKGCQNCAPCEEGWKSLGVKCYNFFTDKLNWMESRDRCVEKGGHLVIITSEAEQKFLDSIIEETETHWIGLNDLETEGKWMWVNNQTLTETGVEFWVKRQDKPDEPDNWKHEDPAGENCGGMWSRLGSLKTWFDSSCQGRRKFICEK